MSSKQFHSVDYNIHQRLLQREFPGLSRIEILDEQCNVLYSPTHPDDARKKPFTKRCETSISTTSTSILENDQDRTITILHPMYDKQGVFYAFLAITSTDDQFSNPESRQAFIDMTATVCDVISNEISLLDELDSMALELGRRYEELNLVYKIKDQAVRGRVGYQSCLPSVQQMVDDCATFLDVDYAAAILPQSDFYVSASHDVSLFKSRPITGSNLDTLTRHIKNAPGAIVINSQAEAKELGLDLPDDYRIICAPIELKPERISGLYFVLAKNASHEFSNSDRLLVEIQAEMSSKMLQHQFDPLTGLICKEEFELNLDNRLKNHNHQQTMAIFRFNQFKMINDTFGHETGNKLLRYFSGLIIKNAPKTSLYSRISADEFALSIPTNIKDDFQSIIDRILYDVDNCLQSSSIFPGDCEFNVNVGIVNASETFTSASDWLTAADLACLLAKNNSFERQHIYNKNDEELLQRQSDIIWAGRVKKAILNQQFELYCQPMASLSSGSPHYEILLRIIDEDGKPMPPAKFISAAERYDLMPNIDEWVVKQALSLLSEYDISHFSPDSVWSINLSGQSLSSEKFKNFISDSLSNSVIENHQICFEITETAAISHFDSALDLITTIKDMGSTFSLDDFGSGLSSFTYLKEIPVDYLKIDGSFIRDIETSSVNLSMVEAMKSIGKVMNISTIAEFVETDSIVELLKSIGIDYAQGYAISKPVPLTGILEDLTAQQKVMCI